MGYYRAGFEVVGVDIIDQPNYPHEFHRLDAMQVAYGLMVDVSAIPGYEVSDFQAVHASPPCQAYSSITGSNRDRHPDLVPETRQRLKGSGLPYIIENVVGAPLIDPIQLCGTAFGLPLQRHRLFESSIDLMARRWSIGLRRWGLTG